MHVSKTSVEFRFPCRRFKQRHCKKSAGRLPLFLFRQAMLFVREKSECPHGRRPLQFTEEHSLKFLCGTSNSGDDTHMCQQDQSKECFFYLRAMYLDVIWEHISTKYQVEMLKFCHFLHTSSVICRIILLVIYEHHVKQCRM